MKLSSLFLAGICNHISLKALGKYPNANIAWNRALLCLPNPPMGEQVEQKRKWLEYIEINKSKMQPTYANVQPMDVQRAMQHNMPWHRASVVCEELNARGGGGEGSTQGMSSSAWTILEAHKVYHELFFLDSRFITIYLLKEFDLAVSHLDRLRTEGVISASNGVRAIN